jgi:hypothetical protein
MKLLSTVILGLASVGVGAGGVAVYDNFYWDKELRTQLAEKDKMMASLNDDIKNLKQGLGTLSDKNAAMLTLIDSSMDDTAALAKSNQSAIEKIQSVIKRLAKLQADLHAQLPAQPPAPAN